MEYWGGHLAAWERRSGIRVFHASPLGSRTGFPGGVAQWGVVGLRWLKLADRRLASSSPDGTGRGAAIKGSQRRPVRYRVRVDRWGVRDDADHACRLGWGRWWGWG